MMINLHETITSRLEQEDIELLDKFIKMGLFANRSEAVRVILSKELKELAKKQVKIDIQKLLEKESKITKVDFAVFKRFQERYRKRSEKMKAIFEQLYKERAELMAEKKSFNLEQAKLKAELLSLKKEQTEIKKTIYTLLPKKKKKKKSRTSSRGAY